MNPIITKYLPKELRQLATTFTIPEAFIEKMPDMIELILKSKSLEKAEEKQSWFNLLPLMGPEQIEKLKDILTREKIKLEEIEKKYEQKKLDIKKKYLMKWQSMGYIKKISEMKAKEQASNEKEHEEADNLLASI